jgi:hypothetical protein
LTPRSRRSPPPRASFCRSIPPAKGLRGGSSRSNARSALEQERVAREAVQKSLEGRNAELSKVEGELIVLSITSANQELALQEQGETVRGLERAVEAERRALEVERKQVEGEPLF